MRAKLDMSKAVPVDETTDISQTSAALSNSTHWNEVLQKTTGALQKVFPGKQVGESIGTLAGYIATPKEHRQYYDLSHPSVTQVIGDVGKGAVALTGLEEALPASVWGKAAQFGAYGAAGSAASAAAEGKPAKEVGKEALIGAGTGAATGGAFGLVGKGIQKLLKPFSGFQKATQQAFDSEGIKAPVSAVTDNPALQKLEARFSKGSFGQKIVDQAKLATEQLENKRESIVQKITPDKVQSDENLGKTIQEGLKEYEDNFKLSEGKVYDEFSKTYGKSNVYGMATKDALHTLIKEQGSDYFKGTDPRLSKMFNRLTGADSPELKAIDDKIQELKKEGANPDTIAPLEKEFVNKQAELNKSLSFNELKSTRTSVGEQLQKEPENTALKRLYGALSNDMQSAVKQIGEQSPLDGDAKAAVESLDKLNEGYRTGKAKIESNISQSISMSNPERIAQNLVKRNSADTLKTVKEMIGEERFKEIPKEFLRTNLKNSITRGVFDVEKLKKIIGSFDKETLNELFTPEKQKELNDSITELEKNKTLSDALKKGSKIAQGSQTAFILSQMGKSSGLTAALATGHFGVVAGILAEQAGEYGISRLFTTDLGRKILTEGINPSNLGLLSEAGYSTAQIAKIREAMGEKQTD